MLAAFFFCFALYVLPTLLVAIGAHVHAKKRLVWGKVVLIAASGFLIVWFFVSLVGLAWSSWVLLSWLQVLLTAFAVLTSMVSFVVRRER